MYKVVVVDDEEIIREGLKTLIPWSEYGCEIVAIAEDGAMGAQIIDKYSPDILFTDIRMPDMDGLEMVKKIKENHPGIQITVITGFRDFEYAQKAIHLGVCRFLLKPTKMDELKEALSAMVANLNALSGDTQKDDDDDKTQIKEPSGESGSSFIVSNALKYIEEHYSEKLTLIEVAEKTYVSQWHLSKLLKKHTNQNFCDILNQARIKKAKELLDEPSLKIHEISEIVGFSDVTHFSKIFKKHEGVSPNEFRNQVIASRTT